MITEPESLPGLYALRRALASRAERLAATTSPHALDRVLDARELDAITTRLVALDAVIAEWQVT